MQSKSGPIKIIDSLLAIDNQAFWFAVPSTSSTNMHSYSGSSSLSSVLYILPLQWLSVHNLPLIILYSCSWWWGCSSFQPCISLWDHQWLSDTPRGKTTYTPLSTAARVPLESAAPSIRRSKQTKGWRSLLPRDDEQPCSHWGHQSNTRRSNLYLSTL